MLFLDLGDNSSWSSLSRSGPTVRGRWMGDGRLTMGDESGLRASSLRCLPHLAGGDRGEVTEEGRRRLINFRCGDGGWDAPTVLNGCYPERGRLRAAIGPRLLRGKGFAGGAPVSAGLRLKKNSFYVFLRTRVGAALSPAGSWSLNAFVSVPGGPRRLWQRPGLW